MTSDPAPPPAPDQPRVITVVNIDDQREIRDGLAVLINATQGYRCVGRYRSMEEALASIGPTGPDVALVDIGLPGMSGIDGIKILKERYPTIAPLVLTVYGDDARIFAALCAGACGYLLKKTPPARLLEGVKEAVEGGSPMSPEVARRVIALFREIRPPENAEYELTPHETRLLRMMVEGHNYKSAAKVFGVTTHAISFHMRRIYEKLQVHSKSEAVAKALRNRLV
jgi:DNA-binding NarL/FixJ family response regulator